MGHDQPFIWKRSLCGPGKLRGVESLGISMVGQTVSARLMESQIWHQLASSVRGGVRKGTMDSVFLDARHFSFSQFSVPLVPVKLLPQFWSSEGVI